MIEIVMALWTHLIPSDLVIFSTQAFSLHPPCFWFLCVLLKPSTCESSAWHFTLCRIIHNVFMSFWKSKRCFNCKNTVSDNVRYFFLQFLNSVYKSIYGSTHIQKHVPMFPPCFPLPHPIWIWSNLLQ